MLASVTEKPFDNPDWVFEIKWDGYRAVAFLENDTVRLVSRNHNDLSPRYPELKVLADAVQAKNAILDGEVVVLDETGRPSFSLMQQRTGIRAHGRQAAPNRDLPILYYAFDVLYVDGYDLRRVTLEGRSDRDISVREIMTSPVVVVTPGTSIDECMALMTDRRIRHQQNLRGRRIALVVLTGSTRWSRIRQHGDRIAAAVASAAPGSYSEVEIPFEPK